MPELRVTQHAIKRYQERVANVSEEEVISALVSPAVLAALKFGAPYVRLGTGQRIALSRDGSIVTVLPRGHRHKSSRQWGGGSWN